MWVSPFLQKVEDIYIVGSQETLQMKANWIHTVLQIRLKACMLTCTTGAQRNAQDHTPQDTQTCAHPRAPLQMNESCNMHQSEREINVNPSAVSSSPFLFLSPVTPSQTIQECTFNPPTRAWVREGIDVKAKRAIKVIKSDIFKDTKCLLMSGTRGYFEKLPVMKPDSTNLLNIKMNDKCKHTYVSWTKHLFENDSDHPLWLTAKGRFPKVVFCFCSSFNSFKM